jgi:hypothetical protein
MSTYTIKASLVRLLGTVLLVLSFAYCGSVMATDDTETKTQSSLSTAWDIPRGAKRDFGNAPKIPDGDLSPELQAAVEMAFGDLANTGWGARQTEALTVIAESGDPRLAWMISDLSRIVPDRALATLLTEAASQLLAIEIDSGDHWRAMTDHLIAWDIPAPPAYLKVKRGIYALVFPASDKLFTPGEIDWRHVSWGGVMIDDRPFGTTDEPCNCIPAADNPAVSTEAETTWLGDHEMVFGLGINGEYRAYPRRIMEVREMVNDTLGGRDLGIPYCTLCGSAQAYLTDEMPAGVARPILRTSGLLIRSNKVMYDVNTFSVFDTFTGRAVTGPLAEREIKLNQVGVVTTSWGEWKKAHPDTSVLVEALALGRNFDFRNNRDADGPIFPIGDVDPRLPVQEDVFGVISGSGAAVAFHVASARKALTRGESVVFANIRLKLDGGGLRAFTGDGNDLGGHQAFWFAWSQFHPATRLWPHDDAGITRS